MLVNVHYKLKSEKLFLKLKKIKVYVLRVPGVLIDKNKDLNFLSTLIKKIRNNQNVILYNKENFFNNLILIKELNRLIVHLIKNKFSSGIILLGVKKPIQLQLIAKKIIKFYNYLDFQQSRKLYLFQNNDVVLTTNLPHLQNVFYVYKRFSWLIFLSSKSMENYNTEFYLIKN